MLWERIAGPGHFRILPTDWESQRNGFEQRAVAKLKKFAEESELDDCIGIAFV